MQQSPERSTTRSNGIPSQLIRVRKSRIGQRKICREALDLFKEGKLSQRAITRKTGIHVATLNKRFRGLVKGAGHRLGSNRSGKVLTYGT